MIRFLNYSILALLGALTTNAYGEGPQPPSGIRAESYSRSAVEVFWNRAEDSDGLVIGYDISRDDEFLGRFDALSLFEDNLQAGTHFIYSIISVDNEGNQSEPTTVSISTRSDVEPLLRAPTGLEAAVYSSSAIELFWDRVFNETLNYEVAQDGVTIGQTNGTSAFIDGIEAGQTHQFAIQAIDAQDNRSAKTFVSVTTNALTVSDFPNPDMTSPLLSSGLAVGDAPVILEELREFITARPFFQQLERIADLNDFAQTGRFVSSNPNFSLPEPTVVSLDCPEGGQITSTDFPGFSGAGRVVDQAEGCNLTGTIYNGTRTIQRGGGNAGTQYTIDNFLLQDPESIVLYALSGEITLGDAEGRIDGVQNGSYSLTVNEEILQDVSSLSIVIIRPSAFSPTTTGTTLSVGFLANSSFIADQPFTVTTVETLTKSISELYYTSGSIEVTLLDETVSIIFDANTGDPNTFIATVMDGESVISGEFLWTESTQLPDALSF